MQSAKLGVIRPHDQLLLENSQSCSLIADSLLTSHEINLRAYPVE